MVDFAASVAVVLVLVIFAVVRPAELSVVLMLVVDALNVAELERIVN